MKVIRPQEGPQTQFLRTKADIALYGGAAGGGKTHALLMDPLRDVDDPKFNGIIFRKQAKEIDNVGGLWTEALSMYLPLNARPKKFPQHLFTFNSGAELHFGHLRLDTDIYSFQGAQVCFLGFDELTHFTADQFFYLMSRNRSLSTVQPRIRATTNPDRDSWVRNLIDWWIDPETGYPIQERSGVIRWFVRIDNKLIWADSFEELSQYDEPILDDKGNEIGRHKIAKSFTFIPAKISDNKILMRGDPNYIASLKAQNKVEKERLLYGNWNISYSDLGTVLSRHDFARYNLQEKLKIPGFFREFYWVTDTASTVKTSSDYSVLGLFGRSRIDEKWYIIDWVRVKMLEPDFEQLVVDKWNQWNYLGVKGINIEMGSTGHSLQPRLQRRGIPVFELKPVKDKFQRLNDGLGIIKNQFVLIPDNVEWAEVFFEECECFRADMKHVLLDGETKPHDDQVDVLAYGISSLVNQVTNVGIYVKPKAKKRRGIMWD